MMGWNAATYALQYPMAPLGGLFVATVGLFVMFGAAIRPWRMILLWIGLAAAVGAMVLGGRFEVGLPPATRVQVSFLALAIAMEIIAFRFLMPRIRPRGARAVVVCSLAIVGAHFLIMLPAFGPLIGALGGLCLVNAALAWRAAGYPSGLAWAIDGLLKIAFGAALLLTSPVFHTLPSH